LMHMNTSTAHRYLLALRSAEMLSYDPLSGGYVLGSIALELGAAARAAFPIADIARPYLTDLVGEVDRTAVISAWDGTAPVVLEVNDRTSSIASIRIRVGERLPVFDTAQGLVYLAFSPSIRKLYARDPQMEGLQSVLARIERNRCEVREIDGGQFAAAAAPVLFGKEIIATIAVFGAAHSIPDDPVSPLLVALLSAADSLSAEVTRSAGR